MLILAACLTALYFLPGTQPIWSPNNGKLNSLLDKDNITPALSLLPPKKALHLLYSTLTLYRFYIILKSVYRC